jgi:uncharacterized protein YcgI (DUF1989 family)
MEKHEIPKMSGLSFEVEKGDTFDVINPKGEQIADLVAFNRSDPSETFSQSYTRYLSSLRVSTGDSLYTTEGNSILTIVEDDCGVHDLLYAPCNEWLLDHDRYAQDAPGGCRENLWLSLEPKGFTEADIPDTLNVFQKSTVSEQKFMNSHRSPAEPGDTVTFVADQDAIVAVSSCSAASEVNGDELTGIDVVVPDDSTVHKATVREGVTI